MIIVLLISKIISEINGLIKKSKTIVQPWLAREMQGILPVSPEGCRKDLMVFLLFPAASSPGLRLQQMLPRLCFGPFPQLFILNCSQTPSWSSAGMRHHALQSPWRPPLAGGSSSIQLLSSAGRQNRRSPPIPFVPLSLDHPSSPPPATFFSAKQLRSLPKTLQHCSYLSLC